MEVDVQAISKVKCFVFLKTLDHNSTSCSSDTFQDVHYNIQPQTSKKSQYRNVRNYIAQQVCLPCVIVVD